MSAVSMCETYCTLSTIIHTFSNEEISEMIQYSHKRNLVPAKGKALFLRDQNNNIACEIKNISAGSRNFCK